MPIYEYECKKCEKTFEIIQKFSDKPIKKCPECGGNVEKLISQSSFHLKGSGWFSSGYSKNDKKDTLKDASSDAPAKPPCAGCPSC